MPSGIGLLACPFVKLEGNSLHLKFPARSADNSHKVNFEHRISPHRRHPTLERQLDHQPARRPNLVHRIGTGWLPGNRADDGRFPCGTAVHIVAVRH